MDMEIPAISIACRKDNVAIIDIGSNSVRLVVYETLSRHLTPLFNEKVLCALGKGLSGSGKLNPKGRLMARHAVSDFVMILKSIGINNVHALATAAVRDASDGADLVRELENGGGGYLGLKTALGVSIQVISGEREAEYGAYGVIGSIHQPSGVVGDLGGGSLELVRVMDGSITSRDSIPIGHFRIMEEAEGKPKNALKVLEKKLKNEQALKFLNGRKFYAVGGGFRAIAKVHTAITGYPIRVVHNYMADPYSLAGMLASLVEADKLDQAKFPGLPEEREETIQYSAAVLLKIIELGSPESIIFSAAGVREGYMYSLLKGQERGADALWASARYLAAMSRLNPEYAAALREWLMESLGSMANGNERLITAAAELSEISWSEHPDYRAEFAFQRIIEYPLTGITHPERLMLGLMLFHRYKSKPKKYFNEMAKTLLKDEQIKSAAIIGLLMAFAGKYSRADASALNSIKLRITGGKLELSERKAGAYALIKGDAGKKLDKLADLLGVKKAIT